MAGSAEIGSLRVALGIDSAQFSTGIKKAQSGLGVLGASIKAFAVGAAAALSLRAVTGSITSVIDKADELGKAAQKIGIPVETLSKLEFAARLADVSIEQLSTGVGKLSKAMAAIQGGSGGDAGRALAAIGVSAVDATGKLRATYDVIGDVAEAFSRMKDGAGKTALAIAIFGKSGAELIPLLNEGKKGLAENAAEAEKLGQVYTDKAAKAAEQFNDNMKRLSDAGQGLLNDVIIPLIPKIAELSENFVTFVKTDLAAFVETTKKEFNSLLGIITKINEQISLTQTKSVGGKMVGRGAFPDSMLGDLASAKPEPKAGGPSSRPRLPLVVDKPALLDPPPIIPVENVKALSEAFLQSQFDAKQLNDGVLRLSQSFKETGNAAATLGQQMAQSLGSELTDWLDQAISGTLDLGDALLGVLKNLSNLALNSAFNTLMNNAANPVQGGGFMGGIAKLFGFAQGGSFKVGGSGGIDSQMVAFKASPNERVSVTKPGQGMGGSAELKLIVNDYRTNAPAIEQGRDSSGNLMLSIRDMVNQQIEGRYGAKPQKARR